MNRVLSRALLTALAAIGLQAVTAEAVVIPKKAASLADKSFRQPELFVPELQQTGGQLPALANGLQRELADLGASPDSGFYDSRSGRWSSLVLSQPLVPGTGVGNRLHWEDLGTSRPVDQGALQQQVWRAVTSFLQAHEAQLRVDLSELASPSVGVFEDGNLIQVHAPRQVGGVLVRDSGLTAIINHGNLVLLGLQNWGDAALPSAAITFDAARGTVARHASPELLTSVGAGHLELVPTLRDNAYDFRLAWVVPTSVAGDMGVWEGLVDAVTGDLLAFEDKNQYASRRMVGGVFPLSNDGRSPDGLEQPGFPMPFANVTIGPNTVVTNSGGSLGCSTGSGTTTLSGSFVRMIDSCGAISEVAAADFNLGVSTGTDCTVPTGHSAGDTHSSRTGFYEINRLVEQAKGYLPLNTWLQARLTANMNLNNTCNAFWNGATVNFYRDLGSSCRNTGEIAAIFDHEWGHGMDDNGVNGNISSPGEAIADIFAMMRLDTSCVGRGFRKSSTCGGYGDACIGTSATGCTGVRDLDFARHRCNRPHTISWALNGFTSAQCNNTGAAAACPSSSGTPCSRETHCEGMVAAETGWDLFARDLQAAPFSFDVNTALELATRLHFLGSQSITSWYTCSVGGGCGATNGYMLYLAADDDNGNLNDGTPHMQAIRQAFQRHEIHCATPAVANVGCAGGPTAAPIVTATPGIDSVSLSWTAVAGAARYNVYRTEGVAGCAFGKVKIGNVAGTTFNDTTVLSGRPYLYMVLPVGTNTSCFGRASACAGATPLAATCTAVSAAPQALAVDATGNGVLQPNETAIVVSPTWRNTGTGALALTGALSAFTGPVGPTYTINDATADYGTVSANTNQACTDCYAVTITASGRPAQHWDATALETVAPTATTKNWVLHVGDSFTDVVGSSTFYRFVETIFHKGVTGGCGPNVYCPSASTSREQMAVFVLVSKDGSGANPPACTTPMFADVPAGSPFCRWIEELARRGVVSGCGGGNYCPTTDVSRETMAVFTLRALDPTLNPPACTTPMFDDVPASSPFCRWIEELVRRGVVTGCGGNNYCPAAPVTREEMAVFLTGTFSLTLYGL